MTHDRSGTPSWIRPRATRTSRPICCARSRARSIDCCGRGIGHWHSRRPLARPALEVAELFRDHGPAWREANRGHVSLGQLKVMSAIEDCRTAALGGHVACCENEGAASPRLPTTVAAIGIVPSARRPRRAIGWQHREADLFPVPLLPRRVHAAGRDWRHRLSEQGGNLRPAVQGIERDADHHRRRSPPSRRPHRRHRRAPHLGPDPDPEPSLKIPGIIISLIFSEQRKLVFRATPLQN